MKKRPSMFMFGMRCVRCNHEIIAPHKSEFLDDDVICHLWHCPCCKAMFKFFPRFPKNAKSVKEVMTRVDIFPHFDRAEGQIALGQLGLVVLVATCSRRYAC